MFVIGSSHTGQTFARPMYFCGSPVSPSWEDLGVGGVHALDNPPRIQRWSGFPAHHPYPLEGVAPGRGSEGPPHAGTATSDVRLPRNRTRRRSSTVTPALRKGAFSSVTTNRKRPSIVPQNRRHGERHEHHWSWLASGRGVADSARCGMCTDTREPGGGAPWCRRSSKTNRSHRRTQ